MTKAARERKERLSGYTADDLALIIDQRIILRGKAARNREILKKHLIDGISFEVLAEEYGMSVRGLQDAYYNSLNQLLKYL